MSNPRYNKWKNKKRDKTRRDDSYDKFDRQRRLDKKQSRNSNDE